MAMAQHTSAMQICPHPPLQDPSMHTHASISVAVSCVFIIYCTLTPLLTLHRICLFFAACSHPHCLQLWVVGNMCVLLFPDWRRPFSLFLFFFKLFSPITMFIYSKIIGTSALTIFLLHSVPFFLGESSADLSGKYVRFSSSMSQVTETKQVSELCLEILVSSPRLAEPDFLRKLRCLVIPSQTPFRDFPLPLFHWVPFYFWGASHLSITGRIVSTERKNRKMLANESLRVSSDPLISTPTGSGVVARCPPWTISSLSVSKPSV